MTPRVLTLDEAAAILRVSRRTVQSYIRERRIRAVGRGSGLRVVAASIDDYLDGASAWHRANEAAANPAPARSGAKAARPTDRSKPRSPSDTAGIGMITFLPKRKPRNT